MTSLHTDSVDRGGGSLRVVDWYLGLSFGRKIVVGVAAAVSVLLASYFASLLILSPSERGEGAPSQAGAPAPVSSSASASASASSAPAIALKIERARWEGNKAVVEGKWQGELSSVHCDLLEVDKAERAIDWWDRSVAAEQLFSDKTFSQEFVRTKGRVKDRIEPEGEYKAVCSAQFSEGWSMVDEAPIAGRPPG